MHSMELSHWPSCTSLAVVLLDKQSTALKVKIPRLLSEDYHVVDSS